MLFIRPVDSRSVLVPCATARQVSAAENSENSRCVSSCVAKQSPSQTEIESE